MEGKFSQPNCPKSSNNSDKPPKLEAQERWKETPKLNTTDQIARINLA